MIRNVLPVKTITPYQLAPNEALSTGAINRVIEHLLKNDDLLKEQLDAAGLSHTIVMWTKSASYVPGDIVCYITQRQQVPVAYILLCTKATHIEPIAVLRNDLEVLAEVGWKLIHENTLYLIDSSLLSSEIVVPAVNEVVDEHEQSDDFHCGEVINTMSDFDKLFLRKDLSNYTSQKAKKTDNTKSKAYLPGARVGTQFSSKSYQATVTDGVVEMEMSFSFDNEANKNIEILNPRYYLEYNPVKDKSDVNILGSYYAEDTKTVTMANGLTYKNIRVPGTNVFSTTLTFPKPFVNSSYMIFQSSYLPNQFAFAKTASELVSKTAGDNSVFVGQMFFINKTETSVTAVLPIHPFFSQYGQYVVGVPWINEFKITVVGVVKE